MELILIIGLGALFLFFILVKMRERQMMNAPHCGHEGVKRWVSEERAWLCDVCYQEWLIDHARNV